MIKQTQRRKFFREATGYGVYYGYAKEFACPQATVWVLESAGWTKTELQELQNNGKLTLAYLSMTEIHPSHALFPYLQEEDFMRGKEGPLWNREYGTRIADLRSKRWQNWLRREAGRLLVAASYDGLFLDTLGNVEEPRLERGERMEQLAAAAHVIRALRTSYPEHVLVQNNGIESLVLQTAPLLDGICWEGPLITSIRDTAWTEKVIRILTELAKRHGIVLWMLTQNGGENGDTASKKAEERAIREGFLWYSAPSHYLST